MYSKLIENGYSNKDILDLCVLYEHQIEIFIKSISTLTSDGLCNEAHKLKGGASILMLNNCIEIFDKIEKTKCLENDNKQSINRILHQVNLVKSEVEELKRTATMNH
jgi:hypothetical protein